MFHILGVYTFRLLEDTLSQLNSTCEPKIRHENMRYSDCRRTREQLILAQQVCNAIQKQKRT